MLTLFTLQNTELWLAVLIGLALLAGFLLPYLFEEIERGKVDPGPRFPLGAGDTHPGRRGDPVPEERSAPPRLDETLSLRSFHHVLISLSIVLASGTGIWGLLNHEAWLGALSLGAAILLVWYWGYFAKKAARLPVK